MANHVINPDQQGAYELALTADETLTIDVERPAGPYSPMNITITAHQSDAPVYARLGTTIEPRDPNSVVVPDGSWIQFTAHAPGPDPITVALTSSSDAIVSVARS